MLKTKKQLFNLQAFTLIEMVLAVGILMLVFMASGACLMAVQQTWLKNQERSERLKKLLIIDKIVNANFPNIIPFEWKDDTFKKLPIFLGDGNKIIFAAAHRVNIMQEGAIRFVSIYQEDEKLIVAYRNTPILYWDEARTAGTEEVVAEGVENVSFVFADFDREQRIIWEDDWDEKSRKNLPLAIQMTITWKDETTTCWLRRTAGSGKRSNFGRRFYDRIK